MKLNMNQIKKLVVVMLAVPLMAAAFVSSRASGQTAAADNKEAVDMFATKCKMCHGPKAEKLFDSTKPEAEMVQVILKGKKGEKPPFMPAYEPKGVTEAQATALAAYMKTLKP
jgi:mono/diheme cytochrome c family protein